jgi:hypothetical protein
MKIKLSAFLLLAVFAAAKFNPVAAQNVQSKWLVGLGWSFVDDDGKIAPSFSNLMFVPYPSTVHGGRYLGHGVTVDASVCYSKYSNGKIVNGVEAINVGNGNNLYFSFDLMLKYDLHEFYYQLHKRPEARKDEADANRKKQFMDYFDPYILFGYGYTYRAYYANIAGSPTNNFGLGFNVWIKSFIGINLQAMGKFRMMDKVSNHVLYTAGIVYRFPRGEGQAGEGSKKVNMKF